MKPLREPLNVELLHQLDAGTPVTMLNLMKFRKRSLDGDGSGWDAYRRYSARTVKLLRVHGATVLWAGKTWGTSLGPEADGDWDYMSLVQYPNPAAFLDMMQSDDYAAGNQHRENGTERHLILVMHEDYSKLNR